MLDVVTATERSRGCSSHAKCSGDLQFEELLTLASVGPICSWQCGAELEILRRAFELIPRGPNLIGRFA